MSGVHEMLMLAEGRLTLANTNSTAAIVYQQLMESKLKLLHHQRTRKERKHSHDRGAHSKERAPSFSTIEAP